LNGSGEAQARLAHAGGYAWRDRATSVLRGLGFVEEDLDRPLRTFSGGELTRASLARALGGDPDLLLLDEPTNHLDVANLEWLERELASLDAAVILVAHGRWFPEAVTAATPALGARAAWASSSLSRRAAAARSWRRKGSRSRSAAVSCCATRPSRSSGASTSRSSARTAPARRPCSSGWCGAKVSVSGTACRSATSRSRRWSSTRVAPSSNACRR